MNAQPLTRTGAFTHASGWAWATGAFALVLAVLLGAYWHTAASLVWVWAHDGTYQYAFLIFPLSAWLAFDLRQRLRAGAPVPSAWGLAAVVVLAAVWYVGQLMDVNLLRHFAFVTLFPALVLACWGWRALRVLAFPLAYLVVFAVPWGDGLVGPLQDITAWFAVHALDITGIPVLLNGREIVTPSATWMVEQACSGVKFFIACAALGCLFSYLMYQRPWKRVAFVLLAAIVPVIANGLRVYFTVLIGEAFGLHYATGTDHMIFGWQFFGTVLVLLLLVGWFFRDPPAPRRKWPLERAPVAGARRGVWPVAIALLVATPLAAFAVGSATTQVQHVQLDAPRIAGFGAPQAPNGVWKPSFKGAAGTLFTAYRSDAAGDAVDVFHAVYLGKPRAGHNLITYGNDVYDPAQSRVLMGSGRQVDLAGGASVSARELRLAEPTGSRLVWYWYCVDDACGASPVAAKLRQVWDTLRGRPAHSSVWALSATIVNGNADRTREQLAAFARVLPVHDVLLSGGRP
ncbi:MAG TPA: exosortase A [Rhodanobacteraceae bacterium]